MVSDAVLVVGVVFSLFLTSNSVLSFTGHYRRELSLIRTSAAGLAWIGTIVAWGLARAICPAASWR